MHNTDVIVVGGGAVGLATAWYLRADGANVTVVDRMSVDEKASTGNAGMLVPSHVVPLSAPGVIAKGLKMLMNGGAPFHIKPRASAAFARWLWLFARHATDRHVAYAVPHLRDLSLASVEMFADLCGADSETGREFPDLVAAGFARTGLLTLHRTEKTRAEDYYVADVAERAGLTVDRMDAEATRALEPDIRTDIIGSAYFRQDAAIHPEKFIVALKKALVARGVTFVDGTVAGIDRRVGVLLKEPTVDGRRSLPADQYVIAAGAWSPQVVASLGFRLPVEPARGYGLTIKQHEAGIRIPCVLTDEKITVTPMAGELRFTGTLTLSGYDRRIETRRAEPIRHLAQLYAGPSVAIEKPQMWSGFRPASPDGLPMIGPVPGAPGVHLATGHGMMGVTLAPVTGRLIADRVAGRAPTIEDKAFLPGRFA